MKTRALLFLNTLALLAAVFIACGHGGDNHTPPPPAEDSRPRVLISTDLGGSDKDDTQSIVHALLYSDAYRVEGLVSSWKNGKASAFHEAIDVYAKDYPQLLKHGPYPTPDYLHSIVRQGATAPSPAAGWSTATEGSRLIVERALAPSAYPLDVIVWGSITDVAQAVHDAPEIKQKIRLCSSGSWNTRQDEAARAFLATHTDLLWVEQDHSGRGIYLTGLNDKSRYGNIGFVRDVVKPAGALGAYYYQQSKTINVNAYGMKMGDTGTLLFALYGNWSNPGADSWGGRYCQYGPRFWGDCHDKELAIGGYTGARTVSVHRQQILEDFEHKLSRLHP